MDEIEDIGSVIDSIIEKMGINRKLSTSNIFNHWEEIVGNEIGQKTKPQKIRDGTLYIYTTTSTWATELSMMSEYLLKKINNYVGKDIVKNFRFQAKL